MSSFPSCILALKTPTTSKPRPSTRMHGGLTRYNYDQLGAEVGKDVRAGLAESGAVSKQHDNSGYTPPHAQHGQSSAAAVMTHCRAGFLQQIAKHELFLTQRFDR